MHYFITIWYESLAACHVLYLQNMQIVKHITVLEKLIIADSSGIYDLFSLY